MYIEKTFFLIFVINFHNKKGNKTIQKRQQ